MSRKSYLWLLTGVYLVWWVLMAIKPLDFFDWALENALVVMAAVLLVSTYKSFPLDQVVNIVDSCSFCMAIPNIIAIYLLMPELRADLASYWQRVVLKRTVESPNVA